MSQPSAKGSLSDPNAAGNVCGTESLVLQLDDLFIAIQTLSSPRLLRLVLAPRAVGMLLWWKVRLSRTSKVSAGAG
jgi:hypothetical protein